MENEQTIPTPTDTVNTKETSPIQPEEPKNFWEKAAERIKTSKVFYGYYLATVVVLSQLPAVILLGLYQLIINSSSSLFPLEVFYYSVGLISFFIILILLNRIIYKILYTLILFALLIAAILKFVELPDASGLGVFASLLIFFGVITVALTLEYFRNSKYIVWLVKILFLIVIITLFSSYYFGYISNQNNIKKQEVKLDMKIHALNKFRSGDYTTPTDMISLCKRTAMYKDSECHLQAALKYDDIQSCMGGGYFPCIKQFLATKEAPEYQRYCDILTNKSAGDLLRAGCYSLVKPEVKYDISTYCTKDTNDTYAFCHAGLGEITGDWIFCEDTRLMGEKKKSCYGLMTQAFNSTIIEDNKPRKNIPSSCIISVVKNREEIDCASILK